MEEAKKVRKVGRPPAIDPLCRFVSLPLTVDMYEQLARRASEEGRPIPNLIRYLLKSALG